MGVGTVDQLSKNGQRYILSTAWQRICEVLDGIEDEEQLSSHAPLLLRVCLGSVKHFVSLVFHHFCEHVIVDHLIQYKYNAVEDLWSDFVKYVKGNTCELHDQLTDLGNEGHKHDKMYIQLCRAYRMAHFQIHRVSYPAHTADYASPSLGKRVVINPPDPTKFLDDNFHIMNSMEPFVVEPL